MQIALYFLKRHMYTKSKTLMYHCQLKKVRGKYEVRSCNGRNQRTW